MTIEKDQLVKYFTLEQLKTVEKEFVDVMENIKDFLNMNIDNHVKWQLLIREVNHNNNYEYANPDQVREIANLGYTEHLDIMCGDYKATGVEIMVSINEHTVCDTENLACDKKVLCFSQFFDINLHGEDYPFENITIQDLDGAIEELETMKSKGLKVEGSCKYLDFTLDGNMYGVEIDEEKGTISIYKSLESEELEGTEDYILSTLNVRNLMK